MRELIAPSSRERPRPVVPTANPKRLTATANRLILAPDERALGKDAPLGRAVQRSGVIVAIPILSGLHHHYVQI
jgi:hypothetical protein